MAKYSPITTVSDKDIQRFRNFLDLFDFDIDPEKLKSEATWLRKWSDTISRPTLVDIRAVNRDIISAKEDLFREIGDYLLGVMSFAHIKRLKTCSKTDIANRYAELERWRDGLTLRIKSVVDDANSEQRTTETIFDQVGLTDTEKLVCRSLLHVSVNAPLVSEIPSAHTWLMGKPDWKNQIPDTVGCFKTHWKNARKRLRTAYIPEALKRFDKCRNYSTGRGCGTAARVYGGRTGK